MHPNVKKVLIIGGGDGGVAREYTAYPEIEEIDVVEPDELFVQVCREFFPDAAKGFEDSRVNIINKDGLPFLRGRKSDYDVIINDSTDPFGHTEGLFTKEFYGSCCRALKDDGIMVYQHACCCRQPCRNRNSYPLQRKRRTVVLPALLRFFLYHRRHRRAGFRCGAGGRNGTDSRF